MKNLFILAFLIFTLSCSKDDDNSSTPQETPVDVFIGGQDGSSIAVWKNNSSPTLIAASNPNIYDMFIDGSDQYLVGDEIYNGKRTAIRKKMETQHI